MKKIEKGNTSNVELNEGIDHTLSVMYPITMKVTYRNLYACMDKDLTLQKIYILGNKGTSLIIKQR